MSAMCEKVERQRAAGAALGELEAAHAAGCPRCVADEKARLQVARALAGRGARAAEDGDAALVARLRAGAEARLERRARAAWRWPALAGVAVVGAALAVVLGLRGREASLGGGAPPPRPGAMMSDGVSGRSAEPPAPLPDDAALVRGLAELSNVERGLARGADWDAALAPVAAAGDLAPRARAPLGAARLQKLRRNH